LQKDTKVEGLFAKVRFRNLMECLAGCQYDEKHGNFLLEGLCFYLL